MMIFMAARLRGILCIIGKPSQSKIIFEIYERPNAATKILFDFLEVPNDEDSHNSNCQCGER